MACDESSLENAEMSGKCLGDHISDEQYEAIRTGTFEGVAVGDYWNLNGMKFYICGLNQGGERSANMPQYPHLRGIDFDYPVTHCLLIPRERAAKKTASWRKLKKKGKWRTARRSKHNE